MRRLLAIFAIVVLASACRNETRVAAPQQPRQKASSRSDITMIPPPAGVESGEPNLALTPNGRVILSWLEKSGTTQSLRFSIFDRGSWSEPRTIVSRESLFANWADFPSIVAVTDSILFAHWLQKMPGGNAYAYDVKLASSKDGGSTWSNAVLPYTDRTNAEHGFVSLVPDPAHESVYVAWIDGRGMPDESGPGQMALHFTTVSANGAVGEDVVLDDRTCECCQTTMVATADGLATFYRDRSEKEIRDTAVVRRAGETWTSPAIVHSDNWEIHGCPLNGPQADARGRDVVVAWFTAAGERPAVNAAFSHDGGATFSTPIRIDDGSPLGRVDTAMLPDGSAVVTWLEQKGNGADVRGRLIRADGSRGEAIVFGNVAKGRKSGFPRVVANGTMLFVAWTDPDTDTPVKVAMRQLGR